MLYISEGRLIRNEQGADTELHSGVLQSYVGRVRESARRNEWKYSGRGAQFTGAYEADTDPESRVAAIRSQILCARHYGDELIYSIDIDGVSGIYRRGMTDGESEGVVISSGEEAYGTFDLSGERMAVAVSFAGESHIGVCRLGETDCPIYTEGHTRDFDPVWSKTERDTLYFCTAGLAVKNTAESDTRAPKPDSYEGMLSKMYASAESAVQGPASICRLHLKSGEIDELISDDAYDYLHPQSAADGSLFYIRRPYQAPKGNSSLGCLTDILLFPVRMVSAIIGFFNVFSMKYAGKTIRRSDVKQKDEAQLFIDGNLINAARELKANSAKGEKNPGVIPRSWELHRRFPDGRDETVKRGVTAYLFDDATGELLVSNGSAVLRLDRDGKEEKVSSCRSVTRIISF